MNRATRKARVNEMRTRQKELSSSGIKWLEGPIKLKGKIRPRNKIKVKLKHKVRDSFKIYSSEVKTKPRMGIERAKPKKRRNIQQMRNLNLNWREGLRVKLETVGKVGIDSGSYEGIWQAQSL